MLNIIQQDALNKFKSLEPKDINIDLFYDNNYIMVDFPLNDEFDLVLYFKSDVSKPDDYSILCENTKYHKAVYASQYDSDLDEDAKVDFSFMLQHIEEFILSGEYKNKQEVFFEKSDLESSWVSEKEHQNPMKAYDMSNSDFI